MDLPLITIPPSAPHTHTIISLHGRGDTARSFASALFYSQDSHNRSLPDIFPSIRWVFPQSETRTCTSLANEEISQWFDIANVNDFSENEELQTVGLKESVASIRFILSNEAALLGGRWDRIVLAGISQGGATAVHALLNLSLPPKVGGDGKPAACRLGAFIGFSSRMPFPGRSLAETRKILGLLNEKEMNDNQIIRNTPVLLEHCVDDPLVLVGSGRGLCDTLLEYGADVTWKEYPNGGHWLNSPQGIEDVVAFMNQRIFLVK